MTTANENRPGAAPSHGSVHPAGALTELRGANAALQVHPQGRVILSAWCGMDGGLDLWSVDPPGLLRTAPIASELSDVGATVEAELIPPGDSVDRERWPAHLLPVVDVSLSRNGQLAAAAAGRGVRLFRLAGDGTELVATGTLRGHQAGVTRVALTNAGDRVLSTESLGQIIVWDVASSRPIHRFRMSRVPHWTGFIWNDMLAAVGDDQGRVVCWELEAGKRHLQFQAHNGVVQGGAFNPDLGTMLTHGSDNCVRVWDLEQGRQVGPDMEHDGPVADARFVQGGRFIVSLTQQGEIAIWNATEGRLLDWYRAPGPLFRIAYHKQSATLYASGARGVLAFTVDWQLVRELDALRRTSTTTKAARLADLSAAPHRPDATFNPTPGREAPVGAILTPHMTLDLPLPDRSQLPLQRGMDPATALAGVSTAGLMNPGNRTVALSASAIPAMPTAPSEPLAEPGGAFAPPVRPQTSQGAFGDIAPPPQPGVVPIGSKPPGSLVSPFRSETGTVLQRSGPVPDAGPASRGTPPAFAFAPPAAPAQAPAAPFSGASSPGAGAFPPRQPFAPTSAIPAVPGPPQPGLRPPGAPSSPAVPASTFAPPVAQAAEPAPSPFSFGAAAGAPGFSGQHAAPAPPPPFGRAAPSTQALQALPSRASGVGPSLAAPPSPPSGVEPGAGSRRAEQMIADYGLDVSEAEVMAASLREARARANASEASARAFVVIALFAIALVGGATGLAAYRHFTGDGLPSAVRDQQARIETESTTAQDSAESDYQAFEAEQRQAIAAYRKDPRMLPTEVERVVRVTERRIEEKRAEADRRIAEVRDKAETAVASLHASRVDAASDLAYRAGGIAAGAAALIALILYFTRRRSFS
jgi:hypothetical protein